MGIAKQLKIMKRLHPTDKLFPAIADGASQLTWEEIETGLRKVLSQRVAIKQERQTLAATARKTLLSRMSVAPGKQGKAPAPKKRPKAPELKLEAMPSWETKL